MDMKEWYCEHCGKIVEKRTMPDPYYKGNCNHQIAELRWKLSSGNQNYKTSKNIKNHAWYDVEEYLETRGSLPTVEEYQQELNERNESREDINERIRQHEEALQNDANFDDWIEDDDDPTEYDNKPKNEKNSFLQSLKNIFSKK